MCTIILIVTLQLKCTELTFIKFPPHFMAESKFSKQYEEEEREGGGKNKEEGKGKEERKMLSLRHHMLTHDGNI